MCLGAQGKIISTFLELEEESWGREKISQKSAAMGFQCCYLGKVIKIIGVVMAGVEWNGKGSGRENGVF